MMQTATSQPLQRAADQLHDAIQSSRRRRQSAQSFDATLGSVNSSKTSGLKLDDRQSTHENDKENQYHRFNAAIVPEPTNHLNSKRDSINAATSKAPKFNKYDCLDYEIRVSDINEEEDALSLSQLSTSSMVFSTNANEEALFPSTTSSRLPSLPSVAKLKGEDDKMIDMVTLKALDWMQRDTERQAKENKIMREALLCAIHRISNFIDELVDPGHQHRQTMREMSTHSNSNHHFSLIDINILVDAWEDTLLKWRETVMSTQNELAERCLLFQEEFEEQVRRMVESHNRERVTDEDYQSGLMASLDRYRSKLTELQRQIDEMTHQTVEATSNDRMDQAEHEHFIQELHRQTLDLAAQLKESELRSLHWQMATTNQANRTKELSENLAMALEECIAYRNDVREATKQMTKMISVDTLLVYQQKIASLECQIDDVKQQIACEHEQFVYEQTKWEYEKKDVGREVQEIQDVSTKVLKVLLIREKMLKKEERHVRRRAEAVEQQHQQAFSQLKAMIEKLMYESGVVLLVLQQLAVHKADHELQSCVSVPVKPIQVKNLLKQLKKLQGEIDRQWLSPLTPSSSESELETTTSLTGFESSDRGGSVNE